MLDEIYLYVRFFTICAAICQSQGDVFLVSLALAARHRKCKRFFFPCVGPKSSSWSQAFLAVASVADVWKGRGRELEHESTREGGGRREEGNACKEAIVFATWPTNLKNNKNNAIVNDSNKSGRNVSILVVFLALFFFCFPKTRNLKWRYYKKVQMRSSIEGIFLESCACRVT